MLGMQLFFSFVHNQQSGHLQYLLWFEISNLITTFREKNAFPAALPFSYSAHGLQIRHTLLDLKLHFICVRQ